MAKFSEFSGFPVVYQGRFVTGAMAQFFDAGGNTPRTVYQDGNLNSAFDPDAILSDASGCLPNIWISGAGAYRCRITFEGVVLRDADNIEGEKQSGGGGGGGGGDTDLVTGDVIAAYTTGTRINFVRVSGRNIGSEASGASELASNDAEALFLLLWEKGCQVNGGRGLSAAADWAANKQLILPDWRGITLAGLDDMGNTPAGRYTGVTFSSGNATTLGSFCGAATVALTADQNGPHAHTGSTDNAGQHNHSGSTSTDGSHSHTGGTSTNGLHSHGGGTTAAGSHGHTGATDTIGDHAHGYQDAGALSTVSTNFGGAVSPATPNEASRSTNGAGAHSHSLIINAVGDHAHGIGADGSHNHSLIINTDGAHAHTYTTNTVAAHLHTFTTASAGLGTAHLNMQPTALITWYMRL